MGSQSYILPSLSASPVVLATPVVSRSTRWCWRRGAAAGNVKRSACRSWGRSSLRLCWTTRTVSSAEDPTPEGFQTRVSLPDHTQGWAGLDSLGVGQALPGQMLSPPTQYFPAQALVLGAGRQLPPSPAPKLGWEDSGQQPSCTSFPVGVGAGLADPCEPQPLPMAPPCRWLLALGHHGRASPGRSGALPATPAAPRAALCAQRAGPSGPGAQG